MVETQPTDTLEIVRRQSPERFLSSMFPIGSHGGMRRPFWAQAAFYGAALLRLSRPGYRLGKLFDLPLYFCTGNAAVAMSFIEVLRGNRFEAWNTVRE